MSTDPREQKDAGELKDEQTEEIAGGRAKLQNISDDDASDVNLTNPKSSETA
jgi:hypothetical protein